MPKYKPHAETGPERWAPWFTPAAGDHRLSCCHCGLIHDFQFRVKAGAIEYRVRQNLRATAAHRRGEKFKHLRKFFALLSP